MEVARKPRDRCQEATPPDPGMRPLWLTLQMENIRLQDELKELKKALQIASAKNSRGIFAAQRFHGEKQTTEALLLSIRDGVDKLRESQDGHEQRLVAIIQEEFQRLRASSVSDKQSEDTALKTSDIHEIGLTITSAEPVQTNVHEKICESTSADSQETFNEPKNMLKLWERFQAAGPFEHDTHKRLTMRKTQESRQGFWYQIFGYFGCADVLLTQSPETWLAKFAQHHIFVSCQTCLILSNAGIMGYEVDAAIKAAVQDPPGEMPAWIELCNLVYTVLFTIELFVRIIAWRSWFWVSPEDWGWNLFDVCVVLFSLMSEIGKESGLNVLRTFRILRAVRAIRVIRVLRFFVELRQMFFAILACMSSLMWCFVFLAVIIFIFSVLILQGISDALNEMEPNSPGHTRARQEAMKWYGSLGDSMFSLLSIFTAGTDFHVFLAPISPAGALYVVAFVLYTLFVIIGVMNVLTGVFLANAEMFADRSLIVLNEQSKQESFVNHMMEVFKELDLDENGSLTWAEFSRALGDENLQAYLSARGFQISHAQLVFDLLDEGNDGTVGLMAFVMGMLRLKGEAKALDTRVIQRQIGMLPQLLRKP